jgi:hypothetical protein
MKAYRHWSWAMTSGMYQMGRACGMYERGKKFIQDIDAETLKEIVYL